MRQLEPHGAKAVLRPVSAVCRPLSEHVSQANVLVQLWLDASIAAHVIPHDPSQLPFPAEMSAVDLGPAVSDAIILMMPSANLCGRPECNVQCKQTQPLLVSPLLHAASSA